MLSGYLVCTCRVCGMAYADHIPSQDRFDAYYRERSKYEYADREGEPPAHDVARFMAVAEEITDLVPDRNRRILEVGASTGGMLLTLRDRGYTNLLGVDPSPMCKEIAARRGIWVEPSLPVAVGAGSFGLILLLAVLEHIRDLGRFVHSLIPLLSSEGELLIQVPDAMGFHRCPDAPFQQFSAEHINYFSATSLGNLLRPSGFGEVSRRQYQVSGGEGCTLPVLDMMFRSLGRGLIAKEFVYDTESGPAIRRYIGNSREMDAHLNRVLEDIGVSGRKIIVWGAGAHTQRLLAEGRLRGIDVVAYVDSNVHLQHSMLDGTLILSPRELHDRSEPILISSRAYQEDIRRQILITLGLKNEVLTLYEL